jgi:hypothetical protein
VLLVAICVVIFALIFWLPPYIAKGRKLSDANEKTVRLLTLLGLFFGITWIVALVLACVYPVDPLMSRYDVKNIPRSPRSGSFDPIPQSFKLETPEAAQEKCENCGKLIGRLETPSIWKNHVVCEACYEILGTRKPSNA